MPRREAAQEVLPTAFPVRVVIDIKNAQTFDWAGALALWGGNMPSGSGGFSQQHGYVWFKVDPLTNAPVNRVVSQNIQRRLIGDAIGQVAHSGENEMVAEIASLREEIGALERAVYHAKSAKEPLQTKTKTAMKKNVRTLYTKWAALDAQVSGVAPVVDVIPDEEASILTKANKAAISRHARLERQRAQALAREPGATGRALAAVLADAEANRARAAYGNTHDAMRMI
jgi:hypothetical protein